MEVHFLLLDSFQKGILNKMKYLVTHKVKNVDEWLSFKEERHEYLLKFAKNISEFVSDKHSVGIVFNVFDEKGLNERHSSEENILRMSKHGVLIGSIEIFKHC